MRRVLLLTILIVLSGCTALLVGGGAGGYPSAADGRSQAVVTADAEITTKIRRQYGADSTLRAFSIGIRTHTGKVSLSGAVPDDRAKDNAARIARETQGVTAVNNRILVDN